MKTSQASQPLCVWHKAQAGRDDSEEGEPGSNLLIWEDRKAGPVVAFDEDSDEEHPGPAEALLGRAASPPAEDDTASEGEHAAPAKEEDMSGDEEEERGPLAAAEERQQPASTLHAWEDRRAATGDQQV